MKYKIRDNSDEFISTKRATADWHEGGNECYVRVSSDYTVVYAESDNGFHINTVTEYFTVKTK